MCVCERERERDGAFSAGGVFSKHPTHRLAPLAAAAAVTAASAFLFFLGSAPAASLPLRLPPFASFPSLGDASSLASSVFQSSSSPMSAYLSYPSLV